MKRTLIRILGTAAMCLLLTAAFSCKSKKQTDTSEAEKQRMEQMEAERQAREEEAARRQREEEERLAKERAAANERKPSEELNKYFDSISSASSESAADKSINEAMNMFSSREVPVLIIIYENTQENVVDYDEPTTIDKYLHYLKVVKRKPDAVKEMKFDANGKISELILKKK